ncbi:hypothetical protein BGY98DRAFT_915134 [Russula aff. rugulosa BPL654]|nr:hypothetical protein BGY98DRAFT_915134 [Russula aff. rugulosa BPL654]
MIYFTTFIFTLLLAHIALFAGDNVTWDAKYDNMDSSTKSIACSGLASKYPHFHNFPDFPYIGSAFDIIGHDSSNCGKFWKLTDTGRLQEKPPLLTSSG